MSLKETLQTFSSANVRRLYMGSFFIFLGFWLTFLSIIWIVFQLTKSSLSLGVMGLVLNLPIFLILPFAGVLADRVNKKKILVVCSIGFLVTPAALAWATLTHHISIPLLIVVAPLYGALYAIMNPAVIACIQNVVDCPEDVHRVTGLLSSNTKIAQLIAAAINGLLHLLLTIFSVFLSAVVAHLISLVAFFRMKSMPTEKHIKHPHPLKQLIIGFHYTFSFSPFWSILMVAATGSLIVLSWQWQLPVFAGEIIGSGSKTLSLLFFIGGVGGIFGGIYISLRHHSRGLMFVAVIALLVIAVGLGLFAFSTSRTFSLILCFFIDGAWVMLLAATSASLQLIVADDKRGRVMSFYAIAVFGFLPFSNFMIGVICNWLGVSWGILIAAVFCALVALFYWSSISFYREQLLPIYKERSIIESDWPI